MHPDAAKPLAMASSTACPGSRSNRSGTGEPAVAYIRSAVADPDERCASWFPALLSAWRLLGVHDLARIGSRIARPPTPGLDLCQELGHVAIEHFGLFQVQRVTGLLEHREA